MGDVPLIPPLPLNENRRPHGDMCQIRKLHEHITFTECESEYQLTLELRNLGLVNIDLTLLTGTLHIKADRKPEVRIAISRNAQIQSRVSRPSLYRMIRLPGDAAQSNIRAA